MNLSKEDDEVHQMYLSLSDSVAIRLSLASYFQIVTSKRKRSARERGFQNSPSFLRRYRQHSVKVRGYNTFLSLVNDEK